MKPIAEKRLKIGLARAGTALLITCLSACDWSADSDLNTSREGTSPAYNAGYEFGIGLAILEQEHPGNDVGEAFEGLCDALSDTNLQFSRIKLCELLQPADLKPAEREPSPPQNFQPPQTQGRSHNIVDFTKDDYIALNASREGMVTLPSGVHYDVLKAGSGEEPQAGDSIRIRYQASLDNGAVIDASDGDGGLVLSLDDIVAPGLKEVLLLMKPGARWQVVLPPSIGYSNPGSRMFRGRENRMYRRRDLIYDIELISVDRPQAAKSSN